MQQNTSISVSEKYKKILNDLLNISHNDACIFSNINNKKNFDVCKKFGDKFFNKVIENEVFFLPLTETDNDEFIRELKKVTTPLDIVELFHKYNEEIPSDIKTKLTSKKSNNIEFLIQEIETKVENERQKAAFKWKILVNEARKLNEQNNLWPIHLGFVYITLRIENKVVQAPLFFKEVNIQIKNSKVSLVSIGDIKINEKLVYFLESNNYLFNLDFDFSKMSIRDLFNEISQSWNQNFELPETLRGEVPNFKEDEIQNEKIEFWPGISLGFFEPTGGHLRKIMLKILENDWLDEVLDIEFDKNIYKTIVRDSIIKKNFGFYKIVYSNLSQDKAIVSALNQNTIIWGPPGTGKSQTITNILTNVLMFNKTAIVVSQKKAALEVLKNRMKALEIFCLFILNDREMNKSTFYKPIKEYINYLENFDEQASENSIKIIRNDEKQLMKLINWIMSNEQVEENFLVFLEFIKNNEFDKEAFEDILSLDKKIQYDLLEARKQKPKKLGKFLMKRNNIAKNNFFVPVNKNIKELVKIIQKKLINLNLDLDFFIAKNNEINLMLLEQINKLKEFKLEENQNDINDDNNLKIIIAKRIFDKFKNCDENLKQKYNAFAMDARIGSLDPIVFIKKHAEIIKIIYPIIITTPETDLQSWDRKEFDYALLDESSQIFLEKGIPILYLAKIKILAGDDQQMQPSRWFSSKNENVENPFGNVESLLDYAIAKGTYSILLDKNYRSNFASLMTFNSQIFYHGELDVVDVNKHDKDEPIEVINADGVWENSQNKKELDIVIEQTLKHLNNYKKIILLCFNASQQNALETLILESYPELEQAIETQKLLIRNIENIQGDEGDLLIASVAYDKNTKLHATYVAKPGGKNALNVAISRAKDKMIIVKSIYSEDIQNNNNSADIAIFKEWLRFLDLNEEEKKNYIYYKNEIRKLNQATQGIEIDRLTNDLINTIDKDIHQAIDFFDEKVKMISNYSIGTIKIPLAFVDRNTNKFIVGIYLDTFKYFKSYSDFIVDKDVANFFKIKKYDVLRINPLIWDNKKEYIINKIQDFYNK